MNQNKMMTHKKEAMTTHSCTHVRTDVYTDMYTHTPQPVNKPGENVTLRPDALPTSLLIANT